MDPFAIAVGKRTLSANIAMKLMVQSWNLVAARSMLRTHIDTALRFYASWLVDDPQSFVIRVMNGERIDKMKDWTGKPMTNAPLVHTLAKEHPWLTKVYKNLSGYIHSTGEHINSSIEKFEEGEMFSYRLAERRPDYPEDSWIEVLKYFQDVTDVLLYYLAGFAETKHLTPDELAAGREWFRTRTTRTMPKQSAKR